MESAVSRRVIRVLPLAKKDKICYCTVIGEGAEVLKKRTKGFVEEEVGHMLCERIRDLREARRLRQTELAELLGVNQRTYSRYELGEVAVSLDVIDRIADFYGTSVDFLMGRTNRMQPYPRPAAVRSEPESAGAMLELPEMGKKPAEKRRA